MARIRSIKPGFFKDSILYDAEKACGLPLRVAYAGLWTVADREGRFKWKPREIKSDVLPYDDVDMVAVLTALIKCGKILKYKCAGEEYGLIPKFLEHQHVNKNEAPSTIPEPPKNSNARAKKVIAPKLTVVAPSTHHEELTAGVLTSGVREQEGEDDDDARELLTRICEIFRVDLNASPDRITWHRQVEEMLRDGLTDTEIIKATEIARAKGKINLAYVRAVAVSPPKEPPPQANGNRRESSHEQTERIARQLARESQASDESANFGTDRRARIALPRVLTDDG